MRAFIVAALVSACVSASAVFAGTTDGRRPIPAEAFFARPQRPLAPPAAFASAPTPGAYSVSDLGTPPGAVGGRSAPLAFDAAGDIVGSEATAGGTACVAWAAGHFILPATPPNVRDCFPETVSADARHAGRYRFGGWVDTSFSGGLIGQTNLQLPFVGDGDVTSASLRFSLDHEPADVGGINAHGVVLAKGYFLPPTATGAPAYAPFVGTRNRLDTFAPLDAACGPAAPSPCMLAPAFSGTSCPFGGCAINDEGMVIGLDWPDLVPIVERLGRPETLHELPLGQVTVDGLNNAGLIAYDQQSGTNHLAFAFDLKTNRSQPLGTLPQRCAAYFPFSLNDLGEIAGFAENCHGSSRTLYWTWTAAAGMQQLVVTGKHYRSWTAVGVDDDGRLLADLVTEAGVHHWATLDPPSPSPAARVRERAVVHVPTHSEAARVAFAQDDGPRSTEGGAAERAPQSAPRALPARPALAGLRRRHAGAGTYAIVDLGAPQADATSAPVAFNDDGQIVGYGRNQATPGLQDCVVYTGTAFVVATTPGETSTCMPSGISNVDGGGHYRFVGSGSGAFVQGPYGVYGTGDRRRAMFTDLAHHLPSSLGAVTRGGLSFGGAFENLGTGQTPAVVAYVLEQYPHTGGFEPLDATCTYPAYCLAPPAGTCPYGACWISDAGYAVNLDADATRATTLDVRSLGAGEMARPLVSNGVVAVTGLNAPGRVAYAAYATGGAIASYVIDVRTRRRTSIPPLPGNSCTTYVPVSQNDRGRVLGYTASCSNPGDATYWLWSVRDGIVNLAPLVPQNSYAAIFPLGINDRDRILVELMTANGAHWGYLQPQP